MTKYVISIDFVVEAEGIRQANTLAESIQNAVAAQVEDKELFNALTDCAVMDVCFFEDEEGGDD